MSLLEILDRPIAYHRCFVGLAGSVSAAVMLSQGIYWQKRVPDGREGWWWKTAREWEEETGIKKDAQAVARKALMRRGGFWTEKRKGIPAKIWFKIDIAALEKALKIQFAGNATTGCSDSPQLDAANNSNKLAGTAATISETTPEIPRDHNHGCGVSAQAPDNQTTVSPIDLTDSFYEADQAAVDGIIATLPIEQKQDVLAVLSAKLSGASDPIRNVPGFVATLTKRAVSGTLTLPPTIQASRKSSKIESRKSEILAVAAEGGSVFLDGRAAEIELGKFVRNAACTVPLAAAIAADRIITTTQQQGASK